MTPYTRPQLVLILLLTGAAAAGLAIDHWRHARPDLAARLEALDRGSPPAAAVQLDVNRAPESEIARLPGVGPALASRIVAARPFADVDDLRRVKGVRRPTLERLRPHVITGP